MSVIRLSSFITMPTFSHRLERIRSRIADACARAGRDPRDITLIAVSKTKPVEAVQEAADSGVTDFGENRVQEAVTKIPVVTGENLRWHLIGHLQSNKAKLAVEHFALVQSVDSADLAARLNRLAGEAGKILPILLQVKLGDEESKSGMDEADLVNVFRQVRELPHLRIDGLMSVPPFLDDPEEVRPFFRRLREWRDAINERFPETPLKELSMGMSHDFDVAIEEGATMVRVGTALFGERNYP
jgi:PLP dependent protein